MKTKTLLRRGYQNIDRGRVRKTPDGQRDRRVERWAAGDREVAVVEKGEPARLAGRDQAGEAGDAIEATGLRAEGADERGATELVVERAVLTGNREPVEQRTELRA